MERNTSSNTQLRNAEQARARQERLAQQETARQQRLSQTERARQERLRATQARLAEQARARRDRVDQAKARRMETQDRMAERGFSDSYYDELFARLGNTAMGDLFSDRQDSSKSKVSDPRPPKVNETPPVSPAEATRQRIMPTLPIEKQKTLGTFDPALINGVIATVTQAREVNPDRTDWDIHLAYRRTIEVVEPDPLMLQKTQISGLLLEGKRTEAHYPF